jgi:phenylacetate-CoA ligase
MQTATHDHAGRNPWETRSLAVALYDAAPWYIQNVLVSARGWMAHRQATGDLVRRFVSEYTRSQWLSPDELAAMQARKLRALMDHVFHNVPYYRDIFERLHLKPENIREPVDLRKLPLLSKHELKRNHDRFIAQNIAARRLIADSTSGTTGTPLTLLHTSQGLATERALQLRMRGWAGWRPGKRRATLNGLKVVPMNKRGLPLWRHDWLENRLLFSVYHMTPDNLGQYLDALRAFHPEVLEGYPTQIGFLAQRLERTGQTLPLKAVFPYAGFVAPENRRRIEERFQCKVFDWYGQAEQVASAAQCELLDGYHVSAEKTIIEIIDQNGQPAAPGEYGEIVGTNLEDYGLPLIRYRTGDISAFRAEPCPCGRGLPIIEQVSGRISDIIIAPDGRLLGCTPFNAILFSHATVERSRVIQEARDRLVILIVPATGYSAADSDAIVAGCRKVMGPNVTVSLQLVDDIPLTANGKYPFVMSKIRGTFEPSLKDLTETLHNTEETS